jgi:hypothetical protein
MQSRARSYRRVRTSAVLTVTSTCMLDVPVWMIRASASTRSPAAIGRVKFTLPTYAVTQ